MTNIKILGEKQINPLFLQRYCKGLVNQFFKILPMRENEEGSLPIFIKGLQEEIIGCMELISQEDSNPMFISLVSVLQYLRDNPNCPVADVRRDVFKAISICNKLSISYGDTNSRNSGGGTFE